MTEDSAEKGPKRGRRRHTHEGPQQANAQLGSVGNGAGDILVRRRSKPRGSCGRRPTGARLQTAEYLRERHLLERLPRQEVRPSRVLRRGLRAGLSGKPVGQEGRPQALRSPGDSEPRYQRERDVLPADVR